MKDQEIVQVIKAWEAQNQAITAIFEQYDDAYYEKEVAPGRNRGVYLLGHLIAVSDQLLPLLGLGEPLFPELENTFFTKADRTVADIPSLSTLKDNWVELNEVLAGHFAGMSREDWLSKHTRVSEEDFGKDPLRNRLNVLITRTGHINYHRGQLAFLTPRT